MNKIVIDYSKCIGCFTCKKVCYQVFEIGEDGKPKVRPDISQGDVEEALTAVINCPVGAIKIIEK